MRFEELVLRIPGDEFRVRFHDQFTVMNGIGAMERQALADGLVGAVAGTNVDSELQYVDRTGRPVEVVSFDGTAVSRYLDDGAPALPLLGTVAPNPEGLRSLLVLGATDLGLGANRRRPEDDGELAEAKALFAALTDELDHARAGHERYDNAQRELVEIDLQLSALADTDTRREYARVLNELEQVREEAARLHSGMAGAEADRHLLESADAARSLTVQWQKASASLHDLIEAYGAAARLDPDEAASLRWLPDQPPSNLGRLIEAATDARREYAELEHRMRGLAASRLPEPSNPKVVDLATLDQSELWVTCHRVVDGKSELHREQLAMGGMATDDGAQAVVERIEDAHGAVVKIEEAIEERRLPSIAGAAIAAMLSLTLAGMSPPIATLLLVLACGCAIVGLALPRRRLQAARKVEQTALTEADASSYLGFHIRRVEATVTPGGKQRLDEASVRYRAATTRWNELVPSMTPDAALAFEDEVRAYATTLAGLGGAAGEIEALRTQLSERAEPAMLDTRDRLAEALDTYGLDKDLADEDDPNVIEGAVIARVAKGRLARLQDELEHAEAEEEKVGNRLDDLLHQLGFAEGTLDDRTGALDLAIAKAAEREHARTGSRPRNEIETDLERLQSDASRLFRPEWASLGPVDDDTVDVAELEHRRDTLLAVVGTPVIDADVDALLDRHAALERRVHALEAQRDEGPTASNGTQVDEVQERLLAHLTIAGRAGPYDDSVPVVLDEPFLRITGDRKWELLDMLSRLAEKTQIIYLTDDPFVGAWARRRASAGEITLLEPIEA